MLSGIKLRVGEAHVEMAVWEGVSSSKKTKNVILL